MFTSPSEMTPVLIGMLLLSGLPFYLGFRHAMKRLADNPNPTVWEIAKHAWVYWGVGVFFTFPICIVSAPALIGGLLFKIGYQHAKHQLADNPDPTFPEIAKQAATHWAIGLILVAPLGLLTLLLVFVTLFGP